MAYFFFFLLIVLSFIYRQSKPLSFVILFFMWIMFGWSYGNADFSSYLDAYNGVSNGGLSLGFKFLFSLYSKAGLSYRFFLVSFSFVTLLILYYSISKLTKNVSFVLGMYLFFPFCLDVVQIKNFSVVVLLTLGVSFLFSLNNRRKSGFVKRAIPIVCFLVCILIATLLQYSAVIYLFLLIPFYLSRNKTIVVTVFLFVALVVTRDMSIFADIASQILPAEWVSSRLFQGTYVDKVTLMVRFIRVFMVGGFTIFNTIILKRSIKNKKGYYQLGFIEFVEKTNIFLLICFPLMLYSQEMYRIQQNYLIINFVATSYVLERKYRITLIDKTISFGSAVFASAFLLYYVILRHNTQTVFVPFFENNLLLGYIL